MPMAIEREPERVGAVGAGHRIGRAAEGSKLRLERFTCGPMMIVAVLDDPQDSVVHGAGQGVGVAPSDR